jgi:spore germination cell wall hydrolase CwlJ-like protein
MNRKLSRRSAGRLQLLVVALALLELLASAEAAAAESPSFRQVRCLAQNIYFEARGEPLRGQLGVAHVVMNRVEDHRFPATICGVIKEGGEARRGACQFSWWCDGQSDRPTDLVAWRRSFEVALQIYLGRTADPTLGALWYHADYVQPEWRRAYVRGPRIGRHLFYLRGGQLSDAR